MKVLLINKFHYKKGGSETYYFTIAQAFNHLGHSVCFFSMQDEKNIVCEQSKYFVSNSSVKGNVKSKLNMIMHIAYSKEAYKKTKELCETEKPDLVILNLVHKQLTCSVIDAIKDYNKDLPIFWTMHDLICVCPSYTMLDGNGNICEKCLHGDFSNCKKNNCAHGSKLMSILSTYEANQIKKHGWYNMVDLFICPSMFYRDKLREGNFTTGKIEWMRNPLPIDTKYELNNHDDKYILFFGRLSKEKGVKTLIDAMKDKKYRLKVLGTGPLEEELKDYIKSNNIPNVELLGFKSGEELTNYVRKSRCVVLPSEWYENGPYSAMEAMALGKPLIVSNLGGLPELVEDSKNGFIFREKSELSTCLDRMINLDEESYTMMCEDSLIKAKEWFNPIIYVNNLILKTKYNAN